VLSLSFSLEKEFLKELGYEHLDSFERKLVSDRHPVLIIGWKLNLTGHCWLVRPLHGDKDFAIAFNQFSIENEVLAPTNDFSQVTYHDESKAFDVNLSGCDDVFYSWVQFGMAITSAELESLFEILGCSWSESLVQRKVFVFRKQDHKARSRLAYLTDISWDKDQGKWKVQGGFVV